MNAILEEIGLMGIVPVIAIDRAEDAGPLAQALITGGLPCAEVTFRTSAAKEAITRIASSYPAMLLGAGTVLTIDQVKAAVDSGAKFIVSPGLNTRVVEYCREHDIPVTPGVATPTEVETALELGLEVVKFFPAEANGGLPFLKAISAPYKNLKFIPTGGIDETNILPYLKFPRVLACGGSWMVKAELMNTKRFEDIQRLTAQAVHTMLGFGLRQVGVHLQQSEAARSAAAYLANAFGLQFSEEASALFAGTQLAFLKREDPARLGTVVIGTHFIHRAIAHLSKAGANVRAETRVEKEGNLVSVVLDYEVEGFAFQLLQV